MWTAVLALPPGDHVFKLVVVDPSGATHWELGANRRLHVPLACVPLSAMSPSPVVKALCEFGHTASTRLQPTDMGGEQLRVSWGYAARAACRRSRRGCTFAGAPRRRCMFAMPALLQPTRTPLA